MREVELEVDGHREIAAVEDRTTLADCLRERLGVTSVLVGCEQGVCGACTVLVDEVPVRSCLMLAAQAHGRSVTTVAGLDRVDPRTAGTLRDQFRQHHAVQCGFCTPGMLVTSLALLRDEPGPDEDQVRDALHGNLCRCTGYQQIIEAVLGAADALGDDRHAGDPS